MTRVEQLRAQERSGRRRSRRSVRGTLSGVFVTSLVATSVPLLASPAAAVPIEPPPAGFEITIFPQRDFVSVAWNAPSQALTFALSRTGVNIGNAASNQADPALPTILTDTGENVLEVNHPGGLCWAGSTPDILPGDRLVVAGGGA